MSETVQGKCPVQPKRAKAVKVKWCLTKCGQGNSIEAKRTATAILEVLAGLRTPTQAGQAVGLSLMRYYQVEARAVQGSTWVLSASEPNPHPAERRCPRRRSPGAASGRARAPHADGTRRARRDREGPARRQPEQGGRRCGPRDLPADAVPEAADLRRRRLSPGGPSQRL